MFSETVTLKVGYLSQRLKFLKVALSPQLLTVTVEKVLPLLTHIYKCAPTILKCGIKFRLSFCVPDFKRLSALLQLVVYIKMDVNKNVLWADKKKIHLYACTNLDRGYIELVWFIVMWSNFVLSVLLFAPYLHIYIYFFFSISTVLV